MKKQTQNQTKIPTAKPSRTAVAKRSSATCKGPDEKQIQPILVFVGVDTLNRITYSFGSPNDPKIDGNFDVPPGGKVQFVSNGCFLVCALEPNNVKGAMIPNRFGGGKPKQQIKFEVPSGALKYDTYKYSVAIIVKGEVLVSDPILRIFG